MWAGIAVVMFVVATVFDYRWLKTLAWPVYALQLGMLVLTLAIGDGVGGSARWVSVGPFTFQFSELAKILMIIVLANYLSSRQGQPRLARIDPGGLRPGRAAPRALVMLQPDLGTSLVFAAILAGMLWMSGASLRWLAVLAAGVVAMVPIAWTYILRDYQKERLTSFLSTDKDLQGAGYQLYQSQIAIGSGGWMGKGLTNGTQAQGDFLPGPDHGLRLRDPGRGARLHRGDGPVRVVRPADLADPRLRVALARSRSGRCSRRASPR